MKDLSHIDRSRVASRPRFRDLWFGPAGLRSGWAALLYAAIVAALLALADLAAARFDLPFRLRAISRRAISSYSSSRWAARC